jgi:hypothetical protein
MTENPKTPREVIAAVRMERRTPFGRESILAGESVAAGVLDALTAEGFIVSRADLQDKADALQAFKDFVHRRLDEAGIPTHPDGEHSKAGCRIGDRLDIALTTPGAMQWRPIWELADRYHQPLLLASPVLIHGDKNPLGIADGFWQDGEGWVVADWCMCHDTFHRRVLAEPDVTHFCIPNGPWSGDELAALEAQGDDAARPSAEGGA